MQASTESHNNNGDMYINGESEGLLAEFERVQLALGVFYRSTDTRTLDTLTSMTPDLHALIPASLLFDVKVQIGSNASPIYCNSFDVMTRMLTVPNVPHGKEWCSRLLAILPQIVGKKMFGWDVHSEITFYKNVVEANPLLEMPWDAVAELLGKHATITINESNFVTSIVPIDVSSSTAWSDLDNVLTSGARAFDKEAISVRGRPYSQKDCYAKVVEINPSREDGWVAVVSSLVHGESVEVGSHTFTRTECIVKVLEINPRHVEGWYRLGEVSATVVVGGVSHGPQQCIQKGLALDPFHANMWLLLGLTLTRPQDTVIVGRRGISYSKMDCLVEAVELDPKLAVGWYCVGVSLFDPHINNNNNTSPSARISPSSSNHDTSSSVVISGSYYTAKDCYLRSLELEAHHPMIWCKMGCLLTDDEPLSGSATDSSSTPSNIVSIVVNGNHFTARQCLLKSIQVDPLYSNGWYYLGNELCKGRHASSIGSMSFSAWECYILSLEVDIEHRDALQTIATQNIQVLLTSGTNNNVPLTRSGNDVIRGDTWLRLGHSLLNREEAFAAVVYGKRHTKKECFVNATLINPMRLDAWWALGKVLRSGEQAIVQGMPFNSYMCFSTALTTEPHRGDAWLDVGQMMQNGQPFIVNGTMYTKEQCLKIGNDLSVKPLVPKAGTPINK